MKLVTLVFCLLLAHAHTASVQVTIDTSRGPKELAVGPINPSFAGFSVEWNIGRLFLPEAQAGHYSITLQLFRNLLEATGSAPTLRIGGNSADETWYPH